MTDAREILHQILSIPGAVGAMAYSPEGAILASDFPADYPMDTLQGMARLLAEDVMVQQALQGEGGGLDLRYQNGRLVLRAFSRGALLALCGGGINLQLVNLALVQAAHRLEKAEAAPARPIPAAPPAPPPPPKYSALGALKEAFVVRIGPIGELLFTRTQADWSAGGKPGDLWDFVARLAKELDDPGDQKAFLKEARAILG